MGAAITKGTVLIVGENRGKILCTYTNHLELVQGEKFHIFYYILSYI